MFELKPLSKDAIESALKRAMRYRLLNAPIQAESICLDILEVEPENEEALVTLLLSLTEQFEHRFAAASREARELLARLPSDYHRAYYEGLIWERAANAQFNRGTRGSGEITYNNLNEALRCYGQAIELRPSGNDDAILRWNSCIRTMDRHPEIRAVQEDNFHPLLE